MVWNGIFWNIGEQSYIVYYPIIFYRKIKVYRFETMNMGRSHWNNGVTGTFLISISTIILIVRDKITFFYRTAIAPLSRRCRTAVAPAQRGYKKFKIELLLLYRHSTVAFAVDRKIHTVVASRGTIRVTVTIGDCQARVPSSSEGCSTSQKTVKV